MTAQEKSSRGLLRLLFVSGAILTSLTVIGVIAWQHARDAQTVAASIANMRPWLTAWRAVLFISLIGLWPSLINALADRYAWSDEKRQHVTAQRWRVAAWLIVIELVLVRNLIAKFIQAAVP